MAEGRSFALAADEVLTEALHEGGLEDTVSGPEAGEDRFGACEEEGSWWRTPIGNPSRMTIADH